MAPKKGVKMATVMVPASSLGEDDAEDKSIVDQEVEQTLEGVESEDTQKVEARIYRSHPATGNRETVCDVIDASLYSVDFLRENYGGGRFRTVFIGPMKGKGGKPGRGQIKMMKAEIDPTIPPKHPRAMTGAVSNADGTPAGPSASGDRLGAVLEGGIINLFNSMQSAQNMQVAVVEKLMQPQKPAINWDVVLPIVVPSVVGLVTALVNRKERDPMDAAREIAKLATEGQKTSAVGDLDKVLELAERFAERMNGNGNGNAGGDNWMSMITEGLKVVSNMRGQPEPAGHVPLVPHDIQVTGTTTVNALPQGHPVPEQKPLPPHLQLIAPAIPQILGWAMQGKRAELTAEWMLSEMPPGFDAILRQQLAVPTLEDDLIGAEPRLAPFKAWLTELKSALLEGLSEEPT